MSFFKRIFLFMTVNVLVMATISIVLRVLGVQPYLTAYGLNYASLAQFCFVWGMGGAFISLAMSRIMAKWMMGVQVIDPREARGAEADLVAMVHRLARSAGLGTLPEVGIYESPEVNAFATGPTRNRALVAVSSGILSAMGRDELEAVLGHEITHVANGDMVTMTLIQGIVNAFVMFFARVIAFLISQNVKEESRGMTRYFTTFILEIALSFLGMIVVAAFSRWREYRADRGGAQLAGTGKMISALRALQEASGAVSTANGAYATLKISSPGRRFSLFASHPPLEDRIAALQAIR